MSLLGSRPFRELRNRVLAGATGLAVRALYLTVRFHDRGWDHVRGQANDGGFIYVLWHNALMIPLGHECRRGVSAFISPGRDGEFAVRVLRSFGVRALRGSTGHRGMQALLEALRRHRGPRRFALTPDGPRGPRYSFASGAAWLASRTGLPVVPIGTAVDRAWMLHTWDGYRIPKPLSRVHLVFGCPLVVPAGVAREGLQHETRRLEGALREASLEASRLAGVPWPD